MIRAERNIPVLALVVLASAFAAESRAQMLCKCSPTVHECILSAEAAEWSIGQRLIPESKPISFAGDFTSDTSYVIHGGVDPGSWAYRQLLDLYLEIDSGEAGGIPGGKWFLHFQQFAGENGNEDVGDLHVYSNIDNPEGFTQMAEVYYEQTLDDGVWRFILGKVDANSQFNYSEVSGDFLNSGKGNNATTFDIMPTYPDPSTAVVAHYQPTDWLRLSGGVFDGRVVQGVSTGQDGFDFGGPFWLVSEVELRWNECLPSRLALGYWHHTFSRFERFDGRGFKNGMSGFYLNYDRALWRQSPGDEEDQRGVYLNVNYGVTDEATNTFPTSITTALVWQGLVGGRDDDSLGITWLWGDVSDDLAPRDDGAIEWYWRIQQNHNISFQPTLIYVDSPGGGFGATWVSTLRVRATF